MNLDDHLLAKEINHESQQFGIGHIDSFPSMRSINSNIFCQFNTHQSQLLGISNEDFLGHP